MTICPECHRLSRDDDFCSYCGAAVFGYTDYSSKTASCLDIDRHSHDKITYDVSERGTRIKEREPVNIDLSSVDSFSDFKKLINSTQAEFTNRSGYPTGANSTGNIREIMKNLNSPDPRKRQPAAGAAIVVAWIVIMLICFITSIL